jgi:hypothetical protein
MVLSQQSTRAKYPLAIIHKALQVLGPDILIGSDIGCSLASTVASSSFASEFRRQNHRLCVNAFHGYLHNAACQHKNHPSIIKGTGLEDLETMERVFSSSNQVASLTRHGSAYNRHVYIDMFFKNWDADKYRNLGLMIYNNYRQALKIITSESIKLAEAKESLGISDHDIESWREEEATYFKTLGKEPEYDVHAITYIELLQSLRDIQ